MLKKVLFGTGMFCLGGATGYFTGKKIFSEQYRADVADVKDFYAQKLNELGVQESDFELPEEDSPEEDKNQEEVVVRGNTPEASDRHKRITDYTQYSKPSLADLKKALDNCGSVVVQANGEEHLGDVDNEEEDEEYVPRDDPEYEAELEQMAEEYAKRRSENMKNGYPYLIEAEEYHDGPEGYDHQALYYYAKDRTLCEDDDREVDDEEECVGFDYEDKLDMQTTCWVRNDKLRVLYEIHRINDSYEKAVLGVSETPREREFRIQGRRKQAMDDQPEKRKGGK